MNSIIVSLQTSIGEQMKYLLSTTAKKFYLRNIIVIFNIIDIIDTLEKMTMFYPMFAKRI